MYKIRPRDVHFITVGSLAASVTNGICLNFLTLLLLHPGISRYSYGLDVRFSVGTREVPPLYSILSSSGSLSAAYPRDTKGSVPVGKAAEAWIWPHFHVSLIKNIGSVPPFAIRLHGVLNYSCLPVHLSVWDRELSLGFKVTFPSTCRFRRQRFDNKPCFRLDTKRSQVMGVIYTKGPNRVWTSSYALHHPNQIPKNFYIGSKTMGKSPKHGLKRHVIASWDDYEVNHR